MPTQVNITEEEEVEVLGTTPGKKQDSEEDQDSSSEEEDVEDASSVTTEVVKPPSKFDPTAYIDLTSRDICRAVYTVSFRSQKKRVKLVCGRVGCRFHTETEERAKGRFYIRQSRGGFDHGRADLPSLTKKEFEESYDEFAAKFEKDIGSISQEQTVEFETDDSEKEKVPSTPKDPPMSAFAKAISSFVSPKSTTPKKSVTVDEGATTYVNRKANSDGETPPFRRPVSSTGSSPTVGKGKSHGMQALPWLSTTRLIGNSVVSGAPRPRRSSG